MRQGRGAFTLIELAVGLILVGLVMTVAYAWTAISSKTADVALRGAARSSEQERLMSGLRDDLAQAMKLTPDPSGNGFTLDLPREDGEVDHVRYACEAAKKGKRLVRTITPAKGAASTRRVAADIEACAGEQVGGRVFRVRVTWAGGKPGSELVVDVVRRVGLLE